jgi:hypothetical protein
MPPGSGLSRLRQFFSALAGVCRRVCGAGSAIKDCLSDPVSHRRAGVEPSARDAADWPGSECGVSGFFAPAPVFGSVDAIVFHDGNQTALEFQKFVDHRRSGEEQTQGCTGPHGRGAGFCDAR